MKKSVLSILTVCFVFIGVLAFSHPVYAKGLLYTFSDIEYVQSRTFSLKSTDGQMTSLYDDTYFHSVVASGQSGEFYVDVPLRFWQWNSNSSVFTDGTGMNLNFVGFVPIVTVRSSLGPALECYITSADLLSNSGQSSPIHLPSSESATNCVFDMSQSLAGNGSNFSDSFVVRMLVHYYCGIKSAAEGQASYVVSGSYTVSFGYKFATLKVYSFDLMTDNRINNQTNTITNGYDNSSMTDDNTRLNDKIAQYDQAQESATNTSVSNIDAAEFISPSSNTSVFAAMTFSASFLQSLYNNLGDFGIVVMVSLSLCLGLMLVGWFKYRR
jgi:hypothetical protein